MSVVEGLHDIRNTIHELRIVAGFTPKSIPKADYKKCINNQGSLRRLDSKPYTDVVKLSGIIE